MPPNYFGSEGNDEDRKKDDSKTTRNVAPHPPQAAEPRARLRAAPSRGTGAGPGGGCWGLSPEHHHGHSLFPQRRVCQYRYTKWQATYEHWSGFSCFFKNEKKERKQYNTENQFVLISTFQIPLTLCYTPALSVIPNSAKKRIKDVQRKQETRYMLLCADT